MIFLERYLKVGYRVNKKRFERLFIAKIIFTLTAILYISASLIYSIEVGANPEISNFDDALYFSVVSIATVGYGDIIPVTELGKWATMGIILSGILVLPWFLRMLMESLIIHSKKNQVTCNSCGLVYHDQDAVYCKACGEKLYHDHMGLL